MNSVSREISDETLNRIITIESAGNPRARASTSSAAGLGQFLSTTWMTTVQKHRPEWMEGKTRQQILNMRFDPARSIEMLARFTEENARMIPGEKDADGDLYLAHFAGVGVAKKLFQAPRNTPAERIFSAAAVAANRSIIAGKTVGQVRDWAETKMRKAGGRDWIGKYIHANQEDARLAAVEAEEEAPIVPREEKPDSEWSYPEVKKEGQGVEGALQVGGGLTVVGIASQVWEKVSNLPESASAALFELMQKPHFWVALLAVGAFAYGWYRWHKYRKDE